jgi:hypothetical protein
MEEAVVKTVVQRFRRFWKISGQFLTRAIPALSADALGFYRFFFGILLLIALYRELKPAAYAFNLEQLHGLAHFQFIAWLSHYLTPITFLYHLTLLACLFFALGFLPRVTYSCAVVGFVLQVLLKNGTHDYTSLLVVLLAYLAVPWQDTWRVDAILRRLIGREKRDRHDLLRYGTRYGFAIWMPSFSLGLAFAAAGYAKLVLSGNRWITEAGVRRALLDDAIKAPSELGLLVVNNYSFAVVVSLVAVVVEIGFLVIPFTRSLKIKLTFLFLAALPLLIGFYVFMGIFWWQWWFLVLLAYAPWTEVLTLLSASTLNREAVAELFNKNVASFKLTKVQVGIISLMLISQVIISALQTEISPLLSNYPMYANIFDRGEERSYLIKLTNDGKDKKITAKWLSQSENTPTASGIPDVTAQAIYSEYLAQRKLSKNSCESLKSILEQKPDSKLKIEVRQLNLTPEQKFLWSSQNMIIALTDQCRESLRKS